MCIGLLFFCFFMHAPLLNFFFLYIFGVSEVFLGLLAVNVSLLPARKYHKFGRFKFSCILVLLLFWLI